jgi:amidase
MIERWTLTEMADRIRRKKISARELIEAHLKRIEQVNPAINAFVCVLAEQALAAASEPTAEGPLAGVPVTIKDQFDIAGIPTLCGSKPRLGSVAARDATAVARLRGAGAILLGKTNVPELVSSYETDNFVTGRTVNPWNPDYTPGGSSGGEAAAIAACCSPGGLGSDGGGSIRVPAHFSGIVGFKPTHRRIGGGGKYPPSLPPAGLMSAAGPMARTVSDVRLLFDVMQGPDDRDSLSTGWCQPHVSAAKPRIGVVRQFYNVPVHPDIAAALDRAAITMRDCGYEVEEFALPGLERAPNVWAFFFGELGSIQTREILAGHENDAHWTITENLRPSPMPDAKAVLTAFAERERLRALTLEAMQRCPVLLTPPCSIPAMRHRERRWQINGQAVGLFAAMAHATIWNLMGFPALVLPFGMTADRLPIGVQLVGRPFEDEVVLETGERMEEARGAFPLAPTAA